MRAGVLTKYIQPPNPDVLLRDIASAACVFHILAPYQRASLMFRCYPASTQ